MRHIKVQDKTSHCQESKQSIEPDLEVTKILELSGREFKISVINMLKAVVKKKVVKKVS